MQTFFSCSLCTLKKITENTGYFDELGYRDVHIRRNTVILKIAKIYYRV